MEDLLQRYKNYLCGEHSNRNTIDNKYAATRILLRQTQGIINTKTIQSLKAWANTHYSHNSRNNKINAWNEYLRWSGHPEHQIKHIGFVETNQHALKEDEIDTILQCAQNNPLENLIILCLFDGALRPSEIFQIKIQNRDGNRLYLDDTKTGDKRIIMSPRLIEAWDEYQKIRPIPKLGHEQYLIIKDKYKEKGKRYLDTDPIRDIVNNIARLAGLTNITPYTIRRTSATLRLNKYSKYYMGDLKLVKDLFRHRDFTTTLKYDRTSDTDIERYFEEQTKRCKSEVPGVNPVVSGVNKQESGINSGKNLINVSPQIEINQETENHNDCFSFSITFFNINIMGGKREEEHIPPYYNIGILTHFTNELPSHNPYDDCDWITCKYQKHTTWVGQNTNGSGAQMIQPQKSNTNYIKCLTTNTETKDLNTLHFEWNLSVYEHRYVNTYMYIEQQQQQQQQTMYQPTICNTIVLYYIHSGVISV